MAIPRPRVLGALYGTPGQGRALGRTPERSGVQVVESWKVWARASALLIRWSRVRVPPDPPLQSHSVNAVASSFLWMRKNDPGLRAVFWLPHRPGSQQLDRVSPLVIGGVDVERRGGAESAVLAVEQWQIVPPGFVLPQVLRPIIAQACVDEHSAWPASLGLLRAPGGCASCAHCAARERIGQSVIQLGLAPCPGGRGSASH